MLAQPAITNIESDFKFHTYNLCCFPVTKSRPTLCNPMNYWMPGSSVLHYLQEFAQTHAHWFSDAIQPSHPLLSPIPLALNLFQHRDLFQWVGSYHQVAKLLELQLQQQSFQMNTLGWFPLGLTGLTLKSKDAQESSLAQFESINSSVLSLLYGPTLTSMHNYWKKHSFDYMDLCRQSAVSALFFF